MPKTWYHMKENRIEDYDSDEVIAKKQFYQRICSDKKPYFFMYNYSDSKTKYDNYVKESDQSTLINFGKTVDELQKSDKLTEEEERYLEHFYRFAPLDCSPGTINRICWRIEKEFSSSNIVKDTKFDYSILKTGVKYKKSDYDEVKKIYKEYAKAMLDYAKSNIDDNDDNYENKCADVQYFKDRCDALCIPEDEFCDIILDICYTTNKSKQFVWDMCGDVIIKKMLESHENKLYMPEKCENGDILFAGEKFTMKEITIRGECDD